MDYDFSARAVVCLSVLLLLAIVLDVGSKGKLRGAIARHRLGCSVLLATIILVILVCAIGSWTDSDRFTKDQRMIESRYVEMIAAFKARDYRTAYSFTSPGYQRSNDIESFRSSFIPYFLEPGHQISVGADKADVYPLSSGFFELYFGPIYHWIKMDGTWYFDDLTFSVD